MCTRPCATEQPPYPVLARPARPPLLDQRPPYSPAPAATLAQLPAAGFSPGRIPYPVISRSPPAAATSRVPLDDESSLASSITVDSLRWGWLRKAHCNAAKLLPCNTRYYRPLVRSGITGLGPYGLSYCWYCQGHGPRPGDGVAAEGAGRGARVPHRRYRRVGRHCTALAA